MIEDDPRRLPLRMDLARQPHTLDLTLLSSATFVPAEPGVGADERVLSIRVLSE